MRTAQEQANLDIVMGLFEKVLRPLDSTHVDEFISPNYIQHSPLAEPGVQPLKDFLDFVHKRSPEATQTLYRSFADGDYVMLHYHVVRHPGDNGLAVVDIFRCEGGMVAEHWDVIQEVKVGGPNPNSVFALGS
jgi:predicted SnoaL-like aldol condensation-catalyzing enzyme